MRRILWVLIDLLLAAWLLVLGLIGPWVNRHLARKRGTGDGRPILLLHGYMMGRGSMLLVGNRLARERRAPARALAYSWLFSMERATQKVAAEAARLAQEAGVPLVDVVAHSLGGLVARRARELGGSAIGRIVTLGTPHKGGWVGHLAVGMMGGEIRRGCGDLEIRDGDLSITSRMDSLIPWTCATLDPPGQTKVVEMWGHAGVLLAAEPIELVCAHLRAGERASVA